jgi:heme/copper-type cytochrome/quinol oxidase subunit 3
MNNKHEKKFIINTLVGLLFTTGGIFSILFVVFNKAQHQQDWIFWAVIAAIAVNTGLLFIGSGAVHKVKADLIRRQKQKSRNEKGMID